MVSGILPMRRSSVLLCQRSMSLGPMPATYEFTVFGAQCHARFFVQIVVLRDFSKLCILVHEKIMSGLLRPLFGRCRCLTVWVGLQLRKTTTKKLPSKRL